MSAPTRALSRGLDVHFDTRVTSLRRSEGVWGVQAQVGQEQARHVGSFDAVLVTTPPEQATALVGAAPGAVASLGPDQP